MCFQQGVLLETKTSCKIRFNKTLRGINALTNKFSTFKNINILAKLDSITVTINYFDKYQLINKI